jgi:GT2 family glycosyltransferase
MVKLPKILVGCPVSDLKKYCTKEYINSVKSLTYPNYDILLVDNSKEPYFYNNLKQQGIPIIKDKYIEPARARIINSRNILRQKVLENYDYFLSLEQDVISPKDIIERLLAHNKDILTGVYYSYQTNNDVNLLTPLLWQFINNDEVRYISNDEIQESKLMKVGACGLGCILISKKILEKIKFRYNPKSNCFDDMFFCLDAKNNNYDIYVDTSIKCKHLILKWNWNNIIK